MDKMFSTWNGFETTADTYAATDTSGTSVSLKSNTHTHTHLALWTQILPHLYPWDAGEVIMIAQDKRRLKLACLN